MTIGAFLSLPLIVGGDFWPSLAIVLAGGVSGSMILALVFVLAVYVLMHGGEKSSGTEPTACVSLHRHGIPCPGRLRAAAARCFRYSCRLRRLADGCVGVARAYRSSHRLGGTIALVWLFNVVGTLDLLNALRHLDVSPAFGAAWYIPTFLVPVLLVTHFMMFVRMLGRARSN